MVEDTAKQEAAVKEAGENLAEALAALAVTSKIAARSATSKRGTFDLTPVVAAYATVRTCEDAYDFAVIDLAGAQGEDL